MDRSAAGYSLTEILAVVLLLSIAAAVAIPNLSATDPSKLDLAAQELAEAMRFARAEAIRTGEPHGFRQQSSAKRIRVFRPDTSASPWTPIYDVLHPISKKLYDIELDDHRFARVDSLSHDRVYRATCNVADHVYFDANGVPRCLDPETVLLDTFEVELALGDHVRTLTLDRITGRVTVQ